MIGHRTLGRGSHVSGYFAGSEKRRRARTLAIGGTVLLLSACARSPQVTWSSPVRNPAGQVTQTVHAPVSALRVGDCVGDISGLGATVEALDVVPCGDPHHYELYASQIMDYDSYPGAETASREAEVFCIEEFETFIGIAYDDSVFSFSAQSPTAKSWLESNDRTILCFVGSSDITSMGTLRGSRK